MDETSDTKCEKCGRVFDDGVLYSHCPNCYTTCSCTFGYVGVVMGYNIVPDDPGEVCPVCNGAWIILRAPEEKPNDTKH